MLEAAARRFRKLLMIVRIVGLTRRFNPNPELTMIFEPNTCGRCGKKLDHSKSEWLELSNATGLYCTGGLPDDESQGCFEFGADCAAAILKNSGKLELVGRAARLNA